MVLWGFIGAVTALCGVAVHRHVWRDPPVDLPWGVLLALATAFSVVRAAALLAGVPGRAGAFLGWVIAMLVLQRSRPEGDFLLSGDALGYVFLLGGMATVGLAVVTGGNADMGTARRGAE